MKGDALDPVDFALLALRLWLGIVLLAHGYQHVKTLGGTASWFSSKGFRQAELNARVSAIGEIAIGLGMMLGFLTGFAALGLVATMTVAYGSIHRFAGFFVFKRPDEGWEYVATLAITSIAVAMLGPGSISIDAAIGWAGSLSGWVGLALGAAGVAVGLAQLATFWRKPDGAAT